MQALAPGGALARLLEIVLSPWSWMVAAALAAVALLLFPLKLAVGGYYWDLYLYPDAAWRIANGQMPHVDFFAPAGPLEYYSYAGLSWLFPSGHYLLLAQWSLLPFTLPLMAWIVPDMLKSRRRMALAVVLPFLFFSFVPLNTKEVYPLAGADGYGIYNRHVCLLLYVLVSSFVFVRNSRKLAILTSVIFTLLLFTKITGAIVGAVIIAYALMAGRLPRSAGLKAAVFLCLVCLAAQSLTGIVSAYFRDIVLLIGMNAGSLLDRFRSPVVMYLDILAPLTGLALLLIWVDRHRLAFLVSQRAGITFRKRIATLLDQDAMWIGLLVAVTIVFETQNTGSLAFIFAWPYLANMFGQWHPRHRDRRTAVLLLIALAALPMFMPMLHRTARVVAASIFYDDLKEPVLGKYADVEAKPELLERAYAMNAHYGSATDRYGKLANDGHQSSYLLYSEIDFQLTWLIASREAVTALQDVEMRRGKKYERLIVADFVDIFTPLLKRQPVRLISIGMAAERTVPPLEGPRLAAALTAEAVLVPLCPLTPVRNSLVQTFKPVMSDMTRTALTPCWALYSRN